MLIVEQPDFWAHQIITHITACSGPAVNHMIQNGNMKWRKSESDVSSCWFLTGGQQTGPPDDRSSHAHSGNLWKIWSSFHHHSRACHRRDVPRYVWNDCSCRNIQPSGKCFLQLSHIHLPRFLTEEIRKLKEAGDWSDWKWPPWGCFDIIGCGTWL